MGLVLYLRCYETCGKPTQCRLNFSRKPKEVLVTNIVEDREELSGETIELRPFQKATFKLKF